MKTEEAVKTRFILPELPYPTNAFEDYIDERTMKIHHTNHHGTYVSKVNKAMEEEGVEPTTIEDICRNISKYSKTIRNNGGGHYNHSLFWTIMSPDGGGTPEGELANAISAAFGSVDGFKNEFESVAASHFGSGWAWLVVRNGELKIGSTPNQDNPLMDISDFKGTPIFGLDVWEHAYYLKYQNRRPEYISSFWNIVNWDEVTKRFLAAL